MATFIVLGINGYRVTDIVLGNKWVGYMITVFTLSRSVSTILLGGVGDTLDTNVERKVLKC